MLVLVHGLWMPGAAMALLEYRLARAGWRTRRYAYPSLRLSLDGNADRLAEWTCALGAGTVHWVAHSLGSLVLLRALARHPGLPPGRAVLLGPPYHGSMAARALAARPLGARLLGHSLPQWTPPAAAAGRDGHDIGVIAGTRSLGLGRLFEPALARDSDGAVGIAETAVPGASRIFVAASHSGLLASRAVAREADCFVRTGRFLARPEGAA